MECFETWWVSSHSFSRSGEVNDLLYSLNSIKRPETLTSMADRGTDLSYESWHSSWQHGGKWNCEMILLTSTRPSVFSCIYKHGFLLLRLSTRNEVACCLTTRDLVVGVKKWQPADMRHGHVLTLTRSVRLNTNIIYTIIN